MTLTLRENAALNEYRSAPINNDRIEIRIRDRGCYHCCSKDDLIIATDLPEVRYIRSDLLHGEMFNTRWTSRPKIFIKDRRLTHVICSDLVYFPDLLALLLRSLIHLTSPPFVVPTAPSPRIIISYKIRSLPEETPFWSAFSLWFEFPSFSRGQLLNLAALFEGTTFVFVSHRRSLIPEIPSDDSDLLTGVGAWGTISQKGDDTFESLLLMAMDDSPQ